jgi:CubicO group peptidase (beta-lactamase class C family)
MLNDPTVCRRKGEAGRLYSHVVRGVAGSGTGHQRAEVRMKHKGLTSKRAVALVVTLLAAAAIVTTTQRPARAYFPARGEWRKQDPAALGLDKARLDEAVAFAVAHETRADRDLAVSIVDQFRNEAPYNTLIGPTQPRGASNGVVIRRGYVAAEWGDTARADMTFSVTKTFLSTVVGVAFDRGLIRSLDDRVGPYMPKAVDLFASEHNAPITWDHLLRQTSDWSGTLWGKPDWADRPPRGQTPEQWPNRELHAPGTFYKYNDTRVNVLALAALHVLKEPLPEVLKKSIMGPIGASGSWHWEGYDNAWVEIDGKRMKSVSGGGHFGGGLFINANDMARFGYLFLRHGRWNDRELVSARWIDMAKTPGTVNPAYGFMNWFLNNPQKRPDRTAGPLPFPSAPRSSVTFQGNGVNVIYIDWANDLVAVVRWIDSNANLDQFLGKVLASITDVKSGSQ